MPELPEVENVAIALRDSLCTKQLTGIRVRYARALMPSPTIVRSRLIGRQVTGVFRHGKYIFIDFEPVESRISTVRPDALVADDKARDVVQLMLHLRMTGQVFTSPDYKTDKHLRLIFDFAGQPVFYRDIRKFGGFTLLTKEFGRAAIPHVGPDMLEISSAEWLNRIHHRRAPIKNLLLDQGIAAGLGNIYADEALFFARLNPLSQPANLTQESLRRLYRQARRILRLAIKHGGTTFQDFVDFQGKPGNFKEKLSVYGRTGEKCAKCSGVVQRIKIGGRSAHFCPICQPE